MEKQLTEKHLLQALLYLRGNVSDENIAEAKIHIEKVLDNLLSPTEPATEKEHEKELLFLMGRFYFQLKKAKDYEAYQQIYEVYAKRFKQLLSPVLQTKGLDITDEENPECKMNVDYHKCRLFELNSKGCHGCQHFNPIEKWDGDISEEMHIALHHCKNVHDCERTAKRIKQYGDRRVSQSKQETETNK